MGQGRPTGATYGAAHARIDLDLSSLTSGAQVARAAGDATAKAIEQSLKVVQNQQKIVIEQAKQATAALQAQQAQITSTTRAESAERIAAARSEAAVTQQQAKAASTATIEEERRKTAAFKQELKERDRSQRQSQVSAGAFAQGAASFVGAAVGGPIGGVVGSLSADNPALAAGILVNQGVKFAVQASQTATTYNRQEVAARSLAGSQGKLNDLMAAYEKASGGAVDKGTELAKVTALEATGFAKSAESLGEFVTGTRGAALAMGKTQEFIGQETQLAIVNQSKRRLDQIGLGVDEVTQRVDKLTKANKSLTSEQAFSQAVIGLQNEKFGALAKSAEGAATGLERLSKAWTDFQLQVGQDTNSPVNGVAGGLANIFQFASDTAAAKAQALQSGNLHAPSNATSAQQLGVWQATNKSNFDSVVTQARQGLWGLAVNLDVLGVSLTKAQKDAILLAGRLNDIRQPTLLPSAANQMGVLAASAPRFRDDQEDALVSWNTKRVAIERESQAAVAAEARSWGNQRLEAERAYTKASVREAEDWSRQQSRTQEDFQESQSKNAAAFTKSQAREERDLGRSVAQAQADDADKVADIRKDSAKRALDIEKDYADQRAKAARDHSDKLLDAAGALDAKAVYQEQRQYAEQAADAEKAHGKQVKDNKDQLQERLDDEAKSLRKSIDQQRTALSQREADQAEDYDQSNKDAQSQFTKEQTRAVQDRGVRLGRMATDQADQLTAIDNAHTANMAAIAKRTDDENKALQTILTDAGIYVKGFVDTSVDDAITAYDKYYTHMDDLLSGKIKPGDSADKGIPATRSSPGGFASGGWVQRGGMALVHTGEYVIPAPRASAMASSAGNIGYSVVFQPGSIVVNEADDAERTANLVIDKINTAFEQRRRAA